MVVFWVPHCRNSVNQDEIFLYWRWVFMIAEFCEGGEGNYGPAPVSQKLGLSMFNKLYGCAAFGVSAVRC